MSLPLIDRLLKSLDPPNGPYHPTATLSTKQAAARFRVPAHSVRARISELRTGVDFRSADYAVDATTRRTKTGRNIAVYSLSF